MRRAPSYAEVGGRGSLLGRHIRWVFRRPRNLEKIALAAQRVSGLGILVYLFFHVFVTGAIAAGPDAWARLMALLAHPLAHVGELLVVGGATFHGVNGIRTVLLELTPLVGRPARPDYPYRVQSLGRGQRSILYTAMLMASLSALAGVVILWGA